VRGCLNLFIFLLSSPPAEEGRVRGSSFKIFSIFFSLPLRERIKVRGAVKSFSFCQPSPRERARVRGSFKIFPFLFSPLAGENKSEGCQLNSFLFIYPLHPAGEGRVRGIVKFSSLLLREKTKVRASVCLLTFKNKFFIIPLEKEFKRRFRHELF
jgi:hypothetical protein